MAGAAQAVPKQLNDSGPNAVNPGVSGGAPLINEAVFLTFTSSEAIRRSWISLAWGDIRSWDESSECVLARLWRSPEVPPSAILLDFDIFMTSSR